MMIFQLVIMLIIGGHIGQAIELHRRQRDVYSSLIKKKSPQIKTVTMVIQYVWF